MEEVEEKVLLSFSFSMIKDGEGRAAAGHSGMSGISKDTA